MKAQDLRQKSLTELGGELDELLKEEFKLRMQHGSGQLGAPHSMRRVRRDIARIKTVMHEKRAGDGS